MSKPTRRKMVADSYYGSKAKKGAFINPFPSGRSVRAESRIAGGGERYTEDAPNRKRKARRK